MLGGGDGGMAVAETSVGSGLVVAFIAVVPLMIAALNLIWHHGPAAENLAGIVVGLVGVLMLDAGCQFRLRPRAGRDRDRLLDRSVGSVLSQRSLRRSRRRHRLRQRDTPAARCSMVLSWLRRRGADGRAGSRPPWRHGSTSVVAVARSNACACVLARRQRRAGLELYLPSTR